MQIGDTAPGFTLESQQGERVDLADLLAAGPLVVYFYIKAKTPG